LTWAAGRGEHVLSKAFSLLPVEEVCLGLIQPALNEIGRRWRSGEASVAQEHCATALSRARLSSLLEHTLVWLDRPEIVAACPPGEWHELGLLMICRFLARRGYQVDDLGANLPADDVARVVQRGRPTLVLSRPRPRRRAEALADVLRRLARLPPPRPEVTYGGWMFKQHPELRAGIAGVYLGPDGAQPAV
jgi:hypothetical protein